MSKQLSLRNAIVHTLLCVFFIFVVATLSSEASAIDNSSAIDNLACEFPNPLVEQHGYSAECTWNIPEDEDTNESLYKVLNISFRTPGGISCYDMAESTQNLDSDDTSGNLHFTSIVVSQNTDCFWRVRLYADSTKTGNVEHFEIDGQSMIYDRLIGLGFSFVDAIVTPITSDEIPIINSRNVTIRARPIEPAESCFYVILNKSQSVSDYNHTDADYFSDNLASLNTDRLKHPDNTLQNILKAGQMTYFSSRDMFERELEFKNDYNEYEPPFLYYGVYCKHGAFSNPAVFGRELLRFGIDTTPPIIKNTSGGVNFTEPDPPGITFEFNEFSISSENQQIFLPSSSGDFVFTTNEPAICKYEFVDSASSQLTYNTLANTANTEFQTDFRVPFDVPIGRNRFLYLACEDEHGNKADSSNREYIFIAFNSSNPFTFFYKDPQPVEWVNTTPIPETQGNQIKVDWELSLNDPSSPLCTSDSMCYVTRYDIYRTDEITGDSVGENKSMFLYNLSENNITYLGYVPAGENTFTDTTAENELDYYYYVMARYYDPLNAGTIQFNSSAITRSNLVNTSDELAPKPVTDLRADLARNNINGTQLRLLWNLSIDDGHPDGANDVVNYTIYRSDQYPFEDNYEFMVTLPSGESQWDDINVIPTTTYCYIVEVNDSSGLATNSTPLCGVRPNSRPYFGVIQNDFNRTYEPVITPSQANAETDITCEVWITDIDGDNLAGNVNFTWSIIKANTGENVIHNQVGQCTNPFKTFRGDVYENFTTFCSSTLDSDLLTKGDTISCLVTAYDGVEYARENRTSPISYTATDYNFIINNTPPTAIDVQIIPNDPPFVPNASSNLFCNYTFFDPDGDAEDTSTGKRQFRWYVNNEGLNQFIPLIGYTSQTLPSNIIDQNDVVKCSVLVHDIDTSFLMNPLPAESFVNSSPVTIYDNSIPQIVNFGSYALNQESDPITNVGEPVVFFAEWLDVDPGEQVTLHVCQDFASSEFQANPNSVFNTTVHFGDNSSNQPVEAIFYSNERGKYVETISLRPSKFQRAGNWVYASESVVEANDFDHGYDLQQFNNTVYFYDKNGDGVFNPGESIVVLNETQGNFAVYDPDMLVEILKGSEPPFLASLRLMNSTNMRFNGTSGSDYDPNQHRIYLANETSDTAVVEGAVRLETVAQDGNHNTFFTAPIYDLYVYEVDYPGQGITPGQDYIAKDNNNWFVLGEYNHFNPEFNAQPLPNKYLAFRWCISPNDDGNCGAITNNGNDSVHVRAVDGSGSDDSSKVNGTANINDDAHNPDIIINYQGTGGGCVGKSFCHADFTAEPYIECEYEVQETDLRNMSYKIRVCDLMGACSLPRMGTFATNHIPQLSTVVIGSGYSPSASNTFGTDSNLMCLHTGASNGNPNNADFVLDGDGNITKFGNVRSRSNVQIPSSLTPFNLTNVQDSLTLRYVKAGYSGFDITKQGIVVSASNDPNPTFNSSTDYIIYDPFGTVTNGTALSNDSESEQNLYTKLSFYDVNGTGDYTYSSSNKDNIDLIIYNVDGNVSYFNNEVSYSFKWYVKPSGTDEFLPATDFMWVDNNYNDILTKGNTMPGDEWICQVTPVDEHGYGVPMNSTPVLIGFGGGDGVTDGPEIISVTDDSTSTNPTPVGGTVNVEITYNDLGSGDVKAYMCSSTNIIRNSGCFDIEFNRTIHNGTLNTQNTMSIQYSPTENDNSPQTYTIMLCDANYRCSDVHTEYDNGTTLQFHVRKKPEFILTSPQIRPFNYTSGPVTYDANTAINCTLNFTINGESSIMSKVNSSHWGNSTVNWTNQQANPRYTWYRNGEALFVNSPFEQLAASSFANGDEIICSARIADNFSIYTDWKNSSKIIIGTTYNSVIQPVIFDVTTNANVSHPVNVGENVTFTINWAGDSDNLPVTAYVCNSSSISQTGCNDILLGSATGSTNPLEITYTVNSADIPSFTNITNYTLDYTVVLTDAAGESNSMNANHSKAGDLVFNYIPSVSNVHVQELSTGRLNCSYDFKNDSENNFKYSPFPSDNSTVTWYKENNGSWDSYNFPQFGNQVPLYLVNDGDLWKCEVTPFDGYATGTTRESPERRVGDTTPQIIDFEFVWFDNGVEKQITKHSPVLRNELITLRVYWFDADDDIITLYVMNLTDPDNNKTEFEYADLFGQVSSSENPIEFTFNTAVLDEYFNGTFMNYTNNITFALFDELNMTYLNLTAHPTEIFVNERPYVENVSVNQTPLNQLICEYDFVDNNYTGIIIGENNNQSKIRWYKNNETTHYSFPQFNNRVPSYLVEFGDVWVCEVLPFDGFVYGPAEMSDEHRVGDTIPQIDSFEFVWFDNGVEKQINQTSPVTHNKLVTLRVYWSDADDDTITLYVLNVTNPQDNSTDLQSAHVFHQVSSTQNPIEYTFNTSVLTNYFNKFSNNFTNNISFALYDQKNITYLNLTAHPTEIFINRPPVVSNVTVERNDSVNYFWCNYTVTDPDTNSIGSSSLDYNHTNVSIRWYVDHTGNGNYSLDPWTEKKISYDTIELSSRWKCSVTPSDPYAKGTTVESKNYFTKIGDAPQLLSAVVSNVISPVQTIPNTNNSRAVIGQNVRFTAVWDDADIYTEFGDTFWLHICETENNLPSGCVNGTTYCAVQTVSNTASCEFNTSLLKTLPTFNLSKYDNNYRINASALVIDLSGQASDFMNVSFYITERPELNLTSPMITNGTTNYDVINVSEDLYCDFTYFDLHSGYNLTYVNTTHVTNGTDNLTSNHFITWYRFRDGAYTKVFDGIRSNRLTASNTQIGDRFVCEVTVRNDYDTYSIPKNSSEVVISTFNEKSPKPRILRVTTPATNVTPVNVGDVLEWTIDWYDVDSPWVSLFICNTSNADSTGCTDSELIKAEYVTDSPFTLEYTVQSSDIANFSVNADYTLNYTLFIYDADGNSANVTQSSSQAASAKFAINHVPTANVDITHISGQPLVCEFDIIDRDHISDLGTSQYTNETGTAKITWHLFDGTSWQVYNFSHTNNQVPVSMQSNGQVWKCEVTPFDGYVHGEPVPSPQLILGETILQITDFTFYANPASGSPYVINATQPATRGDTITVSIDWSGRFNSTVTAYVVNATNNETSLQTAEEFAQATSQAHTINLTISTEDLEDEFGFSNNYTNNISLVLYDGTDIHYLNLTNRPTKIFVNTPPVVSNVTLIENTSQNKLICNYTITDTDTLTFPSTPKKNYNNTLPTFRWYVDTGSGFVFYSIPGNQNISLDLPRNIGGLWRCEVTPNDPYTSGIPEYANNTHSYVSKAPTILTDEVYNVGSPSTINAFPNPVTYGSSVQFVVTWDDLDLQQGSEVVNMYVCANQNSDITGCLDGVSWCSAISTDGFASCIFNTSSSIFNMSKHNESGGYVPAYAILYDSEGLSSGYRNMSFFINQPPYIKDESVNVSNQTPLDNESFYCDFTVLDDDQNAVYSNTSHYLRWYLQRLSTNFEPTIFTSRNMTPDNTQPGDRWFCRVTPTDGFVNGTTIDSPVITVGNAVVFLEKPTIKDVTATGTNAAPVKVGENTTITIDWVHANLGTEEIKVFMCKTNSTEAGTGCYDGSFTPMFTTTASPIVFNYTTRLSDFNAINNFQRTNNTFNFTIMLCDEENRCDTNTSNFTVNRPPVVDSINVDNTTNSSGFLCNVTISDPDKDTYTPFANTSSGNITKWFKYPIGQPDQITQINVANQHFLPYNAVNNDTDVIFCEVTPYDTFHYGEKNQSEILFLGLNEIPQILSYTFRDLSGNVINLTQPILLGGMVNLSMQWDDLDRYNGGETAQMYVCNHSATINEFGCVGTQHKICEISSTSDTDVSCLFNSSLIENFYTNNDTNITLTAKIYDSNLNNSQINLSLFVNRLPVLINATIDPLFPSNSSNLFCNVTVEDYDDAPPSMQGYNNTHVNYKWFMRPNATASWQEFNVGGAPTIVNGFTQLGQEWMCEFTYGDAFHTAPSQNTSKVVIASGVSDSRPNITELRVMSGNAWQLPQATTENSGSTPIKYYDNSTNIGNNVVFEFDWEDADQLATNEEFVRVYLCDTENFINNSGCQNRTLAFKDFTNNNPITFTYTAQSIDQSNQNFTLVICDQGFECSQQVSGSFKVNHPPNATPEIRTYINLEGERTFHCDYEEQYEFQNGGFDNVGDAIASVSAKWYVNIGSGFVEMPLTDPVVQFSVQDTDRVMCSIDITDVFGLSSGIRDSAVLNMATMPVIWPYDWKMYNGTYVVNATDLQVANDNNITIIGYVPNGNGSDVSTITYHGFEMPKDSSTTAKSNVAVNEGSTTVAVSAPLGQKFLLLTQTSSMATKFKQNNSLRIMNHHKQHFTLYNISRTAFQVQPNVFRINLTEPLEHAVPAGTTVTAFSGTSNGTAHFPTGWFNITTPLFLESNSIYLRGNVSGSVTPYNIISMYLDIEAPQFNFTEPTVAGNFNPTLHFTVQDNHVVNVSSISVNVSNGTQSQLFSINDITCTQSNASFVSCSVTVNLNTMKNANDEYNFTITAQDFVGNSNISSFPFSIENIHSLPTPVAFARPVQNSTKLEFGMFMNVTNATAIEYAVGTAMYPSPGWNNTVSSAFLFNSSNASFENLTKFLDFNYNIFYEEGVDAVINSSTLLLNQSSSVFMQGDVLKHFPQNYMTTCNSTGVFNDSCAIVRVLISDIGYNTSFNNETHSVIYNTTPIDNATLLHSIRLNFTGKIKFFDQNNNSMYDWGEPVFNVSDTDNHTLSNITAQLIIPSKKPVLTLALTTDKLDLTSDTVPYRISVRYHNGSSVSDWYSTNPILYKEDFVSEPFDGPSAVIIYDKNETHSEASGFNIDIIHSNNLAWEWTPATPMKEHLGEGILHYEFALGFEPYPYNGWNSVFSWKQTDGQVTQFNLTDVPDIQKDLETDRVYYLTVRARSTFGLPGVISSSNGIIYYDTTAPMVTPYSVGGVTEQTGALFIVNESQSTFEIVMSANEPLKECGYSLFNVPFDASYSIMDECNPIDPNNSTYVTCEITNIDGSALQKGTYTYYIGCVDKNQNANKAFGGDYDTRRVDFVYDYPEPPVVNFTQILANYSWDGTLVSSPIYRDAYLYCDFTAYDPDGDDIVAEQFRWFKNGTMLPAFENKQVLNLTKQFAQRDDVFRCEVRVQDETGRWSSWTSSPNATVINTPPVPATIIKPTQGAFTSNDVDLQWTFEWDKDGDTLNYSISFFNKTPYQTQFSAVNETIQIGFNETTTNTSFDLSAAGLTQNGNYSFVITTCDDSNASNACVNSSMQWFILDTEGPIIDILVPSNNSNVGQHFNIVANVYDLWVDVDSVWVELTNTDDVSENHTMHYNTTSQLASIQLFNDTRGNYSITVYATDSLGNQNSLTKNISITDKRPIIQMDYPPWTVREQALNTSFNLSKFVVENAQIINYTITNYFGELFQTNQYVHSGNIANYNFSDTFPGDIVPEGWYNITFRAWDALGNYEEKWTWFIIDRTPPTYDSIVSPANANINTSLNVSVNWYNNSFEPAVNVYGVLSAEIHINVSSSPVPPALSAFNNSTGISPITNHSTYSFTIPGNYFKKDKYVHWYSCAVDYAGNQNCTGVHTIQVITQELQYNSLNASHFIIRDFNMNADQTYNNTNLSNYLIDPDGLPLNFTSIPLPAGTLLYDPLDNASWSRGLQAKAELSDSAYESMYAVDGNAVLIQKPFPNLLTNPSFEDNYLFTDENGTYNTTAPTGWILKNFAQYSNESIYNYSLYSNHSAGVNVSAKHYFYQVVVDIQSGQPYTLSQWMRRDASMDTNITGRLHVDWYTQGGQFISSTLNLTSDEARPKLTDEWQFYSITTTAPSNEAVARVYADTDHNDTWANIDNMVFQKSSYPTMYTPEPIPKESRLEYPIWPVYGNNTHPLRPYINTTQGTMNFRFTPTWNASDGVQRYLFDIGHPLYGHNFFARTDGEGNLTFTYATQTVTADISAWQPFTTYNVSFIWNSTTIGIYNGTNLTKENHSGSVTQPGADSSLFIGSTRQYLREESEYADGFFDELIIFDFAKTKAQLQKDFNSTPATNNTNVNTEYYTIVYLNATNDAVPLIQVRNLDQPDLEYHQRIFFVAFDGQNYLASNFVDVEVMTTGNLFFKVWVYNTTNNTGIHYNHQNNKPYVVNEDANNIKYSFINNSHLYNWSSELEIRHLRASNVNITDSTVNNSTLRNVNMTNSNVSDSGLLNISEMNNTNMSDSTAINVGRILDSNISANSFIKDSALINTSIIISSNVTNNSVLEYNVHLVNSVVESGNWLGNVNITDSYIDPSRIYNAEVSGDSKIIDSVINGGTFKKALLTEVTLYQTHVSHCTIDRYKHVKNYPIDNGYNITVVDGNFTADNNGECILNEGFVTVSNGTNSFEFNSTLYPGITPNIHHIWNSIPHVSILAYNGSVLTNNGVITGPYIPLRVNISEIGLFNSQENYVNITWRGNYTNADADEKIISPVNRNLLRSNSLVNTSYDQYTDPPKTNATNLFINITVTDRFGNVVSRQASNLTYTYADTFPDGSASNETTTPLPTPSSGGGGGGGRPQREYPDHCYNGVQDVWRGETGVDCGGPCAPCETEDRGPSIFIPVVGRTVTDPEPTPLPQPETPEEPVRQDPPVQYITPDQVPWWLIVLILVLVILAVAAFLGLLIGKNNKKQEELLAKEQALEQKLEKDEAQLAKLASGHSIADSARAGLYAKQPIQNRGPISDSIINLEKYIIASLDAGFKPSRIKQTILDSGWDASVVEVVVNKIMLSADKLEEVERYIASQMEKKVPDKVIADTLMKAHWSSEIVDLIIKNVHKITQDVEQLHQYIELQLLQGKSLDEVHQILVSIGWNEHYIEKVFRKYQNEA